MLRVFHFFSIKKRASTSVYIVQERREKKGCLPILLNSARSKKLSHDVTGRMCACSILSVIYLEQVYRPEN
jgi:hypothetical protein